MDLIERNSLHVIYDYFKIIDGVLSKYESDILENLNSKNLDKIIESWLLKMKDLLSVFDDMERLIKKYLDGEPEDVFQIKKLFDDLKKARFVKQPG